MLLCYSYCCCYWCWSVCRPVFVRPPLPDITFPGQSPQRAVHRYQTIFTWCPVTWLPTVSFPTARWVISIENKALSACPILPFLAKYHIMIYNIIPICITLCSAILMKVTKKNSPSNKDKPSGVQSNLHVCHWRVSGLFLLILMFYGNSFLMLVYKYY